MLSRETFIAKTDKMAKAGTQKTILKWRLFQMTLSVSYFFLILKERKCTRELISNLLSRNLSAPIFNFKKII